ncbi:MAG TPA: DUF3050 domain-containing protein [Sulfuricella sp.]|nr:DUF3050 domain-containing protein [Sulfuricella sp.]
MLNLSYLAPLRARLNSHPVYGSLRNIADLRCFMEHHVFSVWDFMSLAKSLQGTLAPTTVPWRPVGDPAVRRFINEITLEEESDLGLPDSEGRETYASHYELYCLAMSEIGADPGKPKAFVDLTGKEGIAVALRQGEAPAPAREFMSTTFGFIASAKPHVVAAAFALGREHIIPQMFRAFLAGMDISAVEAPAFHYYLERHIHLDEDSHGPLSLRMLEELCGGDPQRIKEAETAACQAVEARIRFWDGVHQAVLAQQQV